MNNFARRLREGKRGRKEEFEESNLAGHGKYHVYYLAAPSDRQLPRWIDFQRHGEHRWKKIYANRNRLPDSRLIRWFRQLKEEPLEVPLLGRNVNLDRDTAEMLARFFINEINRLATGDPSQQADFLCNELHRGGRGCGRTVTRIEADGSTTTWPSVMAAAESLGVVPKCIRERLQGLSNDPEKPIWF